MAWRFALLAFLVGLLWASAAHAGSFTVAAASDLRYALDEVVVAYREAHPDDEVTVIYGSSGKMTTQIINGAPYDLFLSADIAFPEKLREASEAASEPSAYAVGRIVIWSQRHDATALRLEDLTEPSIRRIAIAQPTHAPYGMRAREALKSAGVWEDIQDKLVFGENIAHAAQMARSGAADVGIIALSLANFPALAEHPHHLIDESLHKPLIQGYVVTRRGAGKESVERFLRFKESAPALEIMERYGFVKP